MADITGAMVDIITEPWEDGKSLADPEEAAAEMADLMQRLSLENTPYRVHRVFIPVPETAGV